MTTAGDISVGVAGARRGAALADAVAPGMSVVAVCDLLEPHSRTVADRFGATAYTDVDEFLAHDMDAVIVANWFHQHAPIAIEALRGGKHVLSETTACMTLAEGVALIREVERSGLTYMLAENFAYTARNMELRRRFHHGEVGRLVFAEGNYVHPMTGDEFNEFAPTVDHWRNWLPLIYYCTHALAPILAVTDARPTTVSGFAIPWAADHESIAGTARRADPGGFAVLTTDDGAVITLLQGTLPGRSVSVRIRGTHGVLDNRGDEPVAETGHEDSERAVMDAFGHAIRTGDIPMFGVHRAVEMSVVGIMAYRSAVEGGTPMPLPNLADPDVQRQYEADDNSPPPS